MGTVSLASGSYQDKPLIDHNYMSTDDDVKRSIWSYKLAIALGQSKAFSKIPRRPFHAGCCIE
jgi:choline dehydrogenase